MNYGYTVEEWDEIDNGKWNERYYEVAKAHIEVENIHYPHLFYLIKLAKNQQEEIERLKQSFKLRGKKIIKLQNELIEQSTFYEELLQEKKNSDLNK